MNAATEFDIGPLTWVKSEIELALERADQALQQYALSVAAGDGELTQIKFCRTHLHQVQGALTIVGLDGVTQFVEALESLLEAIEQEKLPADGASITLAGRCLLAIRNYLDDLINGQPNQPLRLFPIYSEVQKARRQKRISATDLFFPDLAIRLPRRKATAAPLDDDEMQRLLRRERARYQRGLLAWLHAPDDHSGIGEMHGAVARIEATQQQSPARAFWWVAKAFLTTLSEGALPAETDVKQLCARVDLQIRRLFEGSHNVAERMLRDALYFVANAPSNDDDVQLVKRTYHLDAAMPAGEAPAPAPHDTALRRLRDTIGAAEDAWNRFCAGTAQALPPFKEHAQALSTAVERLGHTDFRRLAQAITVAANWLSEKPARHSEALAMEIATAILLTHNALDNFQHLGADFAHQVDVMVARIHGCIAGTPPLPGSEIPALHQMSREAQERLLIGQVAKEIQSNLAQIEQVLDGFFRDTEKRSDLTVLDAPLRQVIGALSMMRHDSAVAALKRCASDIKSFSAADYVPQNSDFEHVADQLSLLGFFIDSLPNGTGDFDSFLRKMQPAAEEEVESEEPAATFEDEVAQQKRDTHALLEALKEQPSDAGLREELKHSLSALQMDADLGADIALGQQAKAVLSALEAGNDSAPQIDEAIASFKSQTVDTPQPSAATIQLAQASSEEIDAELLAIFLEEANEVLATIHENIDLLKAQPHNTDVLTTIRRSFHTLKGSGRMVGLKSLGEVAWSIEQVLNLWLRQELEVGAQIFSLLDQAEDVFGAWVGHLETSSGVAPDATQLQALAESLRRGLEEGQDLVSPPAPVPPPAATEAPAAGIEEAPVPSVPDMHAEALGATASEEIATEESIDFTFELPEVTEAATTEEAEPPVTEALQEEAIPAQMLTAPTEAAEVNAPINETSDFDDLSFELAPEKTSDAQDAQPAQEAAPAAESEILPELPEEAPPAPEETPAKEAPAELRISISPTLNEIFLDEAQAHLLSLQREFSVLDAAVTAATPAEMYRAAHTLAGIAGTVGLTPINRLGHALEHALLRRDHAAHPDSLEALEVIRQTIAELELMLAAIREKRTPQAAPRLVDALEDIYRTALEMPPAQEAGSEAAAPAEAAAAANAGTVQESANIAPETRLVQDELDEQLLPIFLEEAVELSQNITTELRNWRTDPNDRGITQTLARLLHTLKGSARMAGAMNLGEITHTIESRVDTAHRTGNVPPDLIDEIDGAFDSVIQIIDRLQHGEPLEAPAATKTGESAEPADGSAPVAASVSTTATDLDAETEAGAQRATLRIRADLIDRLVNEAGELSIARARIEGEMRGLKESLLDLTENVIRLRRQLRDIEIQAETQMQSRTAQADERHAGFDPLEFDRFTRFQELTRMMAESVNDVATVQQNLFKNLDDANAAILAQARLNREVQQELMSVRMVPFGRVADRLYRIVRQTAKELGKRANLEIRGGQVEIDRSVLDKISAPLEHMLRNAVAHGLEDRETRLAQGKTDIGEISLTLSREGNEIILNFADDGAGLDFDRIRARGLENGMLAADEVADTTRLVELIFSPGFSTASEISQVAGRGVGMDVVKTEVSSLGGRIEVVSTPGKGTSFRLYIPLTLAVTNALLVRAGSKQYAIPSTMIEQVLDLKEASLTRIRDAGAAEWMGKHYPFNYLPHLLGDHQALPEKRRQYWVLLLKSGSQHIAVQVDALNGNQEIVVKNIGAQLAHVIGIDGATVLGNGQVVLILNPVALTSHIPTIAFAAPVPTEQAPVTNDTVSALPTVMVVDDSLTVRKITGRLLAREGYQVITAKDGVDALEQLLDVLPDVMLVDIEMPRMDGFDLTRNVRADARLKNIPIIMITSRTADKHRNYAFEIGVNQYLGKPYEEEELLRYVAEYVRLQRGV